MDTDETDIWGEATDEPGIEPTSDVDDARRKAEREFLAARDAYFREHGIEITRG